MLHKVSQLVLAYIQFGQKKEKVVNAQQDWSLEGVEGSLLSWPILVLLTDHVTILGV